jgi:hypothetical protein
MFFLRDKKFISEKAKSDSAAFLLGLFLGTSLEISTEVRFAGCSAAEDVFPLLNMPKLA